jgi:hypothetical protein
MEQSHWVARNEVLRLCGQRRDNVLPARSWTNPSRLEDTRQPLGAVYPRGDDVARQETTVAYRQILANCETARA